MFLIQESDGNVLQICLILHVYVSLACCSVTRPDRFAVSIQQVKAKGKKVTSLEFVEKLINPIIEHKFHQSVNLKHFGG